MANPSYGRSFVPRPRTPASEEPPTVPSLPLALPQRPAPPRNAYADPRARYGFGEARHSRPDPTEPPDLPEPDRRGWSWLLVIPIVMPLLVPLYNRVEPSLWGIPFFYWYQLGCAFLAIVVITLVYQLTKGGRG
jgi:hypothetical protein